MLKTIKSIKNETLPQLELSFFSQGTLSVLFNASVKDVVDLEGVRVNSRIGNVYFADVSSKGLQNLRTHDGVSRIQYMNGQVVA